MAPILLLSAALSIVVVLVLFLGARHLDRRLRQFDPNAEIKALRATVENQEERLRTLEALVADAPLDLPTDAEPDAEARPERRRTRT